MVGEREYMDCDELSQKSFIIENNDGIARTSDFAANGINKYEVAAFCKEGFIERIRRGFYQLPQSNSTTEEQLIHELLPQGIICVEFALFHYGYSDFSPREWSIAVPRTASRAVMKKEPRKFVQLRLVAGERPLVYFASYTRISLSGAPGFLYVRDEQGLIGRWRYLFKIPMSAPIRIIGAILTNSHSNE